MHAKVGPNQQSIAKRFQNFIDSEYFYRNIVVKTSYILPISRVLMNTFDAFVSLISCGRKVFSTKIQEISK